MKRRQKAVLVLLLVAGCGGGSRAGDVAPAPVVAPENVRVLGIARRAAMLDVSLSTTDASFALPPSRCQDTLLLVREGEARLAPEGDQELVLTSGDAVRVGPVGPATVRVASGSARLLVVVSRPADAELDPARGLEGLYAPPEQCGRGAAERMERAIAAEVGPFESAQGRLRVSIFLDGREAGGAISSLSLLEGTNDVAVPRHAHEISDEVLFIASGEGTMLRGDERVPVQGPAFVWVPAGMPHGLERSGDAPLVAYQVYAPAGPEQRFRSPTR